MSELSQHTQIVYLLIFKSNHHRFITLAQHCSFPVVLYKHLNTFGSPQILRLKRIIRSCSSIHKGELQKSPGPLRQGLRKGREHGSLRSSTCLLGCFWWRPNALSSEDKDTRCLL